MINFFFLIVVSMQIDSHFGDIATGKRRIERGGF